MILAPFITRLPLAFTWILPPLSTMSPFFFTVSVAEPTLSVYWSSAMRAIPLALSQGRRDGRIKTGDLVLIEAMGGGSAAGSG